MILKKLLTGLALLSLAGNGVLYGMLQRAKLETETMVSAAATSANERLAESLSHQAAAYDAQIAELLRRQEQSDQVTRDALARAEAADSALEGYQDQAQIRASQDASYAAWRDTPVPPSVGESLRNLKRVP